MTFDKVVTYLLRHHDPLWFRTAGDTIVTPDARSWRGGEILTAGGMIVAMQTGSWDEWQLTPGSDRPDSGFPEDEPFMTIPLGEAIVIAEQWAIQEVLGRDLPVKSLKRMGSS